MQEQRKRKTGMPFFHRAMIVDGQRSIVTRARDLSADSLIVETDRAWQMDRHVDIALMLLGQAMMILEGRIIWKGEILNSGESIYQYKIQLESPPLHYQRYVTQALYLDLDARRRNFAPFDHGPANSLIDRATQRIATFMRIRQGKR